MAESITKQECTNIALTLHDCLLEMHKEMIILTAHDTNAKPDRVGLQIEQLIEKCSSQILNYFGKTAVEPQELGFFRSGAGMEDDDLDDAELN